MEDSLVAKVLEALPIACIAVGLVLVLVMAVRG